MRNSGDAHEFFGREADVYGKQYSLKDLAEIYPEHQIRLAIFLQLLEKRGARRVLDVGCGSGEPLVRLLQSGYDARGFDYSEAMVEAAKANVRSHGFDPSLVSRNDMEAIRGIEPGENDCIVGLGSLYYSRSFDSTIEQLSALLPEDGSLIFSLRNELLSLFSLNKYSAEFFLNRLIPSGKLPPDLRGRVSDFIQERFDSPKVTPAFKTVDDKGIFSLFHNPLTVEDTVLKPHGLRLRGIHFYHYHALPPIFEHSDTIAFRQLSLAIEDPEDWRGTFMASAFIVDAVKSSVQDAGG